MFKFKDNDQNDQFKASTGWLDSFNRDTIVYGKKFVGIIVCE